MEMQPQQKKSLGVAILLLTWSAFLLLDENLFSYSEYDATISTTAREAEEEAHRLLNVDETESFAINTANYPLATDGNNITTTSPTTPPVITIYLTDDQINPALSFFKTGMLQRYGSGRFEYHIVEPASCDLSCNTVDNRQSSLALSPPNNDNQLCLAVGRQEKKGCRLSHLKCNYPHCKTMITNDEYCRYKSYDFDVRQYYYSSMSPTVPSSSSDDNNSGGYLPLGPRMDSWESLQQIIAQSKSRLSSSSGVNENSDQEKDDSSIILPASKRKYAFNAIFSQSTNQGRRSLANILHHKLVDGSTNKSVTNMTTYINTARTWRQDVNNPKNHMVNTHQYMSVLLNSVFTLSPAGHNPECFRLYEAVEAGSIPIVTKQDLYRATSLQSSSQVSQCNDSLHYWYDAPIVILDKWIDLYPTVKMLLENKETLNKMQGKLRTWYEEYMKRMVREFEDGLVRRKDEKDDWRVFNVRSQ